MALERLLLLTSLMLISTLLAAFTPYILSLSPRRLKLISTYSVGLLVGAALTVVVPEGVQAVYSSRMRMNAVGSEEGEMGHAQEGEDMAGWIGMALLSGFVLMYLIDTLSPHPSAPSSSHSSRNNHNHRRHSSHAHTHAELEPLSRSTSSSSIGGYGYDLESSILPSSPRDTTSNYSPSSPTTTTHNIPRIKSPSHLSHSHPHSHSHSHLHTHQSSHTLTTSTSFSRLISPSASLSTVIGLLAHSLADGISLGASSLSSHAHSHITETTTTTAAVVSTTKSSLDLIIFLAIMLHKAPTAFALSSLLLSDPTSSAKFNRRSLLAFAFASPLGAILTFFILSIFSSSPTSTASDTTDAIAAASNLAFYTGLTLVFSGGTFLFVATHVMKGKEDGAHTHDEFESDEAGGGGGGEKVGEGLKVFLVMMGMITPGLLGRVVGHGH